MQLGSSLRRSRGHGDGGPRWPPDDLWTSGEPHSKARPRLVPIALATTLVGVAAGWLIATRVLFPPPPPPGDLYAVPDLYEAELAEATARIEDVGLTLGLVEHFRHPSVDSGRVVGQDPLPGQLAAPGREVRVSVSLGVDQRSVPEVAHLRGDHAQQRLEATGFVVVLDTVQSNEPRGRVVSVQPAPGTLIPAPGEVRLIVSIGPPQVAVPNLLGMPEAQARDTLSALGFTVELGEVIGGGFAEQDGKVVGQDPPQDRLLERGSSVHIVIGRRGPPRDTIPGG